jgi:GEVED domain/Secretion system C-terminal sorting domain/SprB repeat
MKKILSTIILLLSVTLVKAQIILLATTSNIPCNGVGTITLTAIGGVSPYFYADSNITFANTTTMTVYMPGSYYFSIVDSVGDTATTVITVGITSSINASVISASNGICGGVSTATLTVTGGTTPYTYKLNGVTKPNNIFTNLNAGTYTATITDASTCSKTTVFNINNSTSLSVSINTLQIPCSNNGSIKAIASNGTAPYTYLWNTMPTQTTAIATGLAPGNYTATATDANGCTGTAVANIQPLIFGVIASRDSICHGDSTLLSATINGNFGTTAMPTGYGVPLFSSSLDEEILNVSIGGFSNSSNCTTTGGPAANGLPASILNRYSNYTHLTPIQMAIGTWIPISLKLGQCGNAAFSGVATIWIDYDHNGNFTPNENVYSTGYGPNQITGTIHTGNITIPSTALSGTTLMRVVFNEANTAMPTGSYNWGETEDYRVNIGYALQGTTTWYPSTGLNTNTGLQVIANPLVTTTYTAVTTDSSVCNDTAVVTITIKNNLLYSTAGSSHVNVNCPLSTNGQISVSETAVTNSLSFLWSNGVTTPTNANIGVGNYSVLITDTAGGCIMLHDSVRSLGVNCGDIGGYVKYDSNSNCIFDAGEIGIPNTMITVNPGNHITYTDANGDYTINGLPYNTYTIVKSNAIGFINTCGNTTTGTISATAPLLTGNFLDSSNLVYNYSVSSWGWCLAPALGNNHRKIYYNHNQTGQTSSGTIYAVFDSISHYGSSVPTHSSINGDTVFWNVANILGNYNANFIDITWNLNPALPMGLSIPWKIGIKNTLHVDTTLYNNQAMFTFTTCTSFDPNEKFVTPQGKTNNGYITTDDAYLTYTVKFQNTGNATAANVVITDAISAHLDITDFQVLNASHAYGIEVINNNVIKFNFFGIMLPDSNTNLQGSNGHITFSIKQKPNLAAGTVINNTAKIYFDYNAPIITGTTTNTIYNKLQAGTNTSNANTACNVCGNGKIMVAANGGIAPFTYTIQPNCTATTVVGNTIQNVAAGNYVIHIKDAIGNVVNNTASVQDNITAITIATVVNTPIKYTTPGSITVTPAGGVAPFTYNWQPSNQTTNELSTNISGTYTCTITDANGCSNVSTYTLLNSALNVSDIITKMNLQLYPNPASDELNLQANTPLNDIRILNMIGKTILTVRAGESKSAKINIQSLSNGIYQVQFQNGGTRTFIIKK